MFVVLFFAQLSIVGHQALAFLHRHHISHRDIKPSNFLASRDGAGALLVLLSDFATAAFFSRAHLLHRLVYTPLYCAPELRDGGAALGYTCAVDVWALGV